MTRLQKYTRLFVAAAVVVALPLFVGSLSFAQDPLPNVRYKIDVIPTPVGVGRVYLTNLNNLGMVVGTQSSDDGTRPFLYHQPNGAFYDLRNIDTLVQQLEALKQVEGLSFGYRFSTMRSINNYGDILGRIHDPVTGEDRACLIETYLSIDPVDWNLSLLPDSVDVSHTGQINDNGDILHYYDRADGARDFCIYRPGLPISADNPLALDLINPNFRGQLNNNGQVAGALENGSAFFFDPNFDSNDPPTLEVFDIVGIANGSSISKSRFSGLNDAGIFAGIVTGTRNGKKGNSSSAYEDVIFRFTSEFEVAVKVSRYTTYVPYSQGINSMNDLCYFREEVGDANGAYLVHTGFSSDPTEHTWHLNDLISDDDAAIQAAWLDDASRKTVSGMSDRSDVDDATGYPQFIVEFYDPDIGARGVALTPFIPGATPGITVTPTDGLITTEAGSADSFNVVLDTEPTDNVTIGVTSDDPSEGMLVDPVNPGGPLQNSISLTFEATNWDQPQTVTITGVDDPDVDGNIAYTIVTAAATSTDLDYNGLDADDVGVTNQDDEQAPTVTYTSTEHGTPDTPLPILDQDMVSSTIEVTDDFQIANLTVTLNISHQRPSDLDVFLIGPNDDVVQLFNYSGDNHLNDFDGISTDGFWNVEVYDTRKKKTGTLNSWSMTVEY